MQRPTSAAPARRLLLAIEGNIGAGKSTLLTALRRHYARELSVAFVDEPVALWEEHGLLAAMYSNKLSRCSFQLMALATRYAAVQEALATSASLIITERSVHSDRACFAKVNLEAEPDRAAYAVAHAALLRTLPSDVRLGTVLLEAPRALLHERIAARGRAAEEAALAPHADGAAPVEAAVPEPPAGLEAPTGPVAAEAAEAERQAAGAASREASRAASSSSGIPDAYLAELEAAHTAYFASLPSESKRAVEASAPPAAVAAAAIEAIEQIRAASAASASPVSVMLDGGAEPS